MSLNPYDQFDSAPPAAPDFDALEKQHGLPSGLLAAVQHAESGGNSSAVSPKGARGTFQFMPETAQAYGIDPTDPVQSADGAARMFADLHKEYGGDLPKMLAGYNYGSGNVAKSGMDNLPQETRDYIKRVTSRLGGDGLIHGTGEFSGNTTDPATGKIYYEGQHVADTGKAPSQYAAADTGTMTDATPQGGNPYDQFDAPAAEQNPYDQFDEKPSDSGSTILGKSLNNMMPSWWKSVGGKLSEIGDNTGSETISGIGEALTKAGKGAEEPIYTRPEDFWRRQGAGILQGTVNLAPVLANPLATMAALDVSGSGETYSAQREAGTSPKEAAARAEGVGAIDALAGLLPFHVAGGAKGVPGKIIGGAVSGAGAGAVMDVGNQALNANIEGDKTPEQRLQQLGESVLQTAIMGGGLAPLHAEAGKPEPVEKKSITPQDLRGANTPEEAVLLEGQNPYDQFDAKPAGEPNAPTTRSNEVPESPSVAEAPAAPTSAEAVIDGNVTGNTPSITTPDAALSPVDVASAEAAQSPLNNLLEPTEAQKEAGNYKKAHIKIHGLDVAIETPKGATRSGTDASGEPWSVDMKNHYGYVKRTMGADGDQVDVYVGDHPESDKAYIVDQNDLATGKFDEHKTILGANSRADARAIYEGGFSDGKGAERIGGITEMPVEQFKEWLKKPQTEPLVKPVDTAALEQKYARYGFKGLDQRLNVLNRQPNPHPAEMAIVQKYRAQKALVPNQSQPRNPSATPAKARDLLQFIKSQGGILPTEESKAELGVMDLNKHLAAGGLVSNRGKHPDYMREAAAEAGYLPQDSSVADFWSKLHDNAQGQRVYTPEAAPQERVEDPAEKEHYAQSLADEYGISTEGKTADQILADVSARQVEKATAEEAEGHGDAWEGHADTAVDEILQDGDIPFDTGDFYGQVRETEREDQASTETPEDVTPARGESEVISGKGGESESGTENADIGAGGISEGQGRSKEASDAALSNSSEIPNGSTESTPSGQQSVIPGAERISDKQFAERRMEGGKKASMPQKSAGSDGGLFDVDGRKEQDLFAQPVSAENAPTEKVPLDEFRPTLKDYTLAEHDKILNDIDEGKYNAEQIKAQFERAAAAKDSIKAELNKFTKPELTKKYRMYRNDFTKAELVDSAYNSILEDFHLGDSISYFVGQETHAQAVKRQISNQTDEDVKKGLERRAANREKYKEQIVTTKQGLTDPQTLEEFRIFVRANGIEKLSDDQLKRYDALSTEETLARRKVEKASAAKVQGVATPEGVSADIIETKHTQKGHDLFVVRLSDRVEKDVYSQLNTAAKRLGGYYSSFRGNGATPGFQFTTRAAAENFVAASKGETVTAERGRKPETRAEKLRNQGQKLIDGGQESLEQDRKVNTHRRAAMAAGAEANAQAEIAMGKTLQAIAEKIEAGTAGALENVNARTELETLSGLMRQAMYKSDRALTDLTHDQREERRRRKFDDADAKNIEYPFPSFHTENVPRIAAEIGDKPGFKMFAQHLLKLQRAALKKGDGYIQVRDKSYIEKVKDAAEKFEHTMGWVAEQGVADYMRAQRLGLTNMPLLRQAVREYASIMAEKPKADPIKEAERALVGRKWDGYFPTPEPLAERMAAELDIRPGDRVLEPSAGKGSLIDAAVKAGADPKNIDALETVSDLQNILKLKGYNVVGRDFLEHAGEYDRIIMNPPFENGQDIDHVRHAYEMLKPGGKMVAIMSEGPFFRGDKKATDFRDWLDNIGGSSEKNPEGSFKDSDRSTGVNTQLVVIEKDGGTVLLSRHGKTGDRSGDGGRPGADKSLPGQERSYDGIPRSAIKLTPLDALDKEQAAFVKTLSDVSQETFGTGLDLKIVSGVTAGDEAVNGLFNPLKNTIYVALNPDALATLNHEGIHFLRNVGALEKVWPILKERAAEKWLGEYKIESKYSDYPKDIQIEEAIAEAFADYATSKRIFRPAENRAFSAMKKFFARLGNALHGYGFNTMEDVFRGIKAGKYRVDAESARAGTSRDDTVRLSRLDDHVATARAEAYHDDGEPRTDRSLTNTKATDGRKNLMIDGILGGQPISTMLRLPFQVAGGYNAKNEFRAGKFIADKASWAKNMAKFKEDGRFQWLNPVLESARSGLINHYGMDDAYKKVRQNRKKTEKAILNQGLDIHKLMEDNGIGVNEATVLHSILTGDTIPDEHWAKISEPIRQAMDQFGQDLVDLNLLSNESYERNKGKYLHRSYLDHEREAQQQTGLMAWGARQQNARRKAIRGNQLKGRGVFVELSPDSLPTQGRKPFAKGQKYAALEQATYKKNPDTGEDVRNIQKRSWLPEGDKVPDRMKDWEKSGWEVRDVSLDGKKITVWRDYTKDERLKMGEILDARYNIIKTVQLMAHDISTGKMFADIASNAEWSTKAPERGDKVATPAEYRRRETMAKYDWVRVPDGTISETGGKKIWGALAGTYVRPEIWRDINETKKLYGSNGIWGSILRTWKANKTFRSPATHMHNVIANVMTSHLQDIRLMDMARAVHSIKTKDGFHQLADEHGAFGSNYVENEITRKVLESVLNDITKSENPQKSTTQAMHDFLFKLHEHGYKAFKKLDNGMMNLYQLEDNVFRMALFHRRLSLGDTPEQAANEARVGFVDYDITAPWINYARSRFLPFISWTYGQVPVLAKAIAYHPEKLLGWAALMYAANAISYALVPGDEDKERALFDEDHKGSVWGMFPRMMRMPMADAQGRPQYMDLRRIVPAGDLADLTQGHAAMNVPPALMPGGPLMLAGEYLFNRQSFTGKDMTNELTDTWGDKAGKVADWAWKSWMPNSPFIPGSYAWNKMKTGITGGKDYFRKEYSPTQAALAVSGINVQSFDAQEEAFWRAHELNNVKDSLLHEMRQAADQHDRGLIGDQEAAKTSARTMEKFTNLQKKVESTFNPPKTDDLVKDAIIQFIRGNGEMPQATPEQIRKGAAAASPALGRILQGQQGVAR